MSSDNVLDWGAAARHPDPEDDLGYEMDQWEAVEARSGEEDLLLFLPSDEELLKVDAFVVAAQEDICDVEDFV